MSIERTKRDYADRYPAFDADGATQVDRCISGVMGKYNGTGPAALARFFEAVHQELAPLARELERQNAELRGIPANGVKDIDAEVTFDEAKAVVDDCDGMITHGTATELLNRFLKTRIAAARAKSGTGQLFI